MLSDVCCHITVIRRLILYVMLYNCYQTSDVRYPFLLNSALLFLIIVKMTLECERDQYIIENKRKPKVTEWRRQRWKMKTLLLQRCASHKFHLIDVPNTRDQILSDQRRSKLLSVNSIHPYKWKSKRMPATYLRFMHNNNLKMKTAGYSCRPQ